MKKSLIIASLMAGLYFVLNFSQFLGAQYDAPVDGQSLSLALLFIAGTFTGFHCAGMCGALVVGYTVNRASEGQGRYLTHLAYGAGKTLSYTVIGGLFGALGSVITFTLFMRGVAGLVAGVFLILFGLATLNLFAPLARFRIRTPAAVMRWLGGALRRNNNPFVIGLLNGLMIICGPLQAMYVMAAGTGSPVEGAKMLFFFGLGTLPLMMGFGFLASALSRQFAPRLVKASGLIVVVLGVIMLNRGYAMIKAESDPTVAVGHAGHDMVVQSAGPQMVHMMIEQPGRVSEIPTLTLGRPVNWMLGGAGLSGCGGELLISPIDQTFELEAGMNQFEFTPAQPGRLDWRCASGTVSGAFWVRGAATEVLAGVPLTDRIRELIERSAGVLDSLRRQLHP